MITLKQKFFYKEKPKNGQIIIIRKKGDYYPRIGKYKILRNGKEVIYLSDLIYLPDHSIIIELNEVEPWWFGISDEVLKKKY